MRGPSQSKRHVFARGVAAWVLQREAGLSLADIGALIQRHGSTVHSMIQRIDFRLWKKEQRVVDAVEEAKEEALAEEPPRRLG